MKQIKIISRKLWFSNGSGPIYKGFLPVKNPDSYPYGYQRPTEELRNLLKAAILNPKITKIIEIYREKYLIPKEGFSYKQYLKLKNYKCKNNPLVFISYDIYFHKIVSRELLIHMLPIIMCHSVELDYSPIEVIADPHGGDSVLIKINDKTTRDHLIKWIKMNKKILDPLLKKIPSQKFKINKDSLDLLEKKPQLVTTEDFLKAEKKEELRKADALREDKDPLSTWLKALSRAKSKISKLSS